MISFHKFWDKINGKMYRRGGPTRYDLADYASEITSNPINNIEGGSDYNYRLMSWEDMGRYAADDVIDQYGKIHTKNPLRLGEPMGDGDLRRHYGQPT